MSKTTNKKNQHFHQSPHLHPDSKNPWRFPINEEKKQSCLHQINNAARKKRIRYYPGFLQCMKSQLYFQSWQYWLLQLLIFVSGILFSRYLQGKVSEGRQLYIALSVFLVIAGNLTLSGIERIFSWHMAELSKTLYLNLKQMVTIQILLAGSLDLLLFSILMLCTKGHIKISLLSMLLYLLVPFLWSNLLYLHLLTLFRREMGRYHQMTIGILSSFCALFPLTWKGAYEVILLPLWGLFLALGILLIILELNRLFVTIEKGEILCLN